MDVFRVLAEERIREAIEDGVFDDNPLQGKPLDLTDYFRVPQELRMAFTMLKNAGYLPPELEKEKEIRSTLDLIEHLEDEEERYLQIRKLNYLVMELNMRYGRSIDLERQELYYPKVVERISVKAGSKSD